MGFEQGLVDPCLFFRNEVVLVVYVDDCLIFSPKKERTDEVVKLPAFIAGLGSKATTNQTLPKTQAAGCSGANQTDTTALTH